MTGVLGAAFNNRLLMVGSRASRRVARRLNRSTFPAQESVALLLLDAHRMLDSSLRTAEDRDLSEALPGCVPRGGRGRPRKGDLNLLINDITVLRATATFMRTAVTRNTPWDRFLVETMAR